MMISNSCQYEKGGYFLKKLYPGVNFSKFREGFGPKNYFICTLIHYQKVNFLIILKATFFRFSGKERNILSYFVRKVTGYICGKGMRKISFPVGSESSSRALSNARQDRLFSAQRRANGNRKNHRFVL